MALAHVVEGDWETINAHLTRHRGDRRFTLIVHAPSEETSSSLSVEERIRALDELAEQNRGLPVLPDEAYSRENLYDERP